MITVKYWIGTVQYTGKARTYRGAMRIASKNSNSYGPQYYDANGEQLHDDGQGLCYYDPKQTVTESGTVVEHRVYAV